jgi:lipoprotein-releasing system ATP-binding protein
VSDLVVRGLTREFPTADGPLPILRGIDLELSRGEALVVTGPSGSGKSTFLYILGALDRPTAGTVEVLGERPLELDPTAAAAFRNARVGFVFQDHHLLPQCTVLENVLIPTLAGSGAGPAAEARARELLQQVGLSHRLTHRPAQLSGGERQRVAVCRALVNQPALLLADEPTGNLDRVTSRAVGSLLLDLARERQAILVCVTHSAELAARFPRWVELEDGRFVPRTANSETRAAAT